MDTLVICPQCESLNRVLVDKANKSTPTCGRCKGYLPLHDGIQEMTPKTLSALISKSSRPVVVDYWAPWCGPCRAFAPTFIEAARKLGGKFVFAKINTEEHPDVGAQYHIRGIPTLIVFSHGKERDRQSGALPLQTLLNYLESPGAGAQVRS
jgi:thioredoxin 2